MSHHHAPPSPTRFVTVLNENDCLMGRGAPSTDYSGNLRFRDLVLQRREEYLSREKRSDKHRIAEEIVATVQQRGGRFLQRVVTAEEAEKLKVPPRTEAWRIIETSPSLFVKVKQLMRDVGPEIRQQRKAQRAARKQASPGEAKQPVAKSQKQQLGASKDRKRPPASQVAQQKHSGTGNADTDDQAYQHQSDTTNAEWEVEEVAGSTSSSSSARRPIKKGTKQKSTSSPSPTTNQQEQPHPPPAVQSAGLASVQQQQPTSNPTNPNSQLAHRFVGAQQRAGQPTNHDLAAQLVGWLAQQELHQQQQAHYSSPPSVQNLGAESLLSQLRAQQQQTQPSALSFIGLLQSTLQPNNPSPLPAQNVLPFLGASQQQPNRMGQDNIALASLLLGMPMSQQHPQQTHTAFLGPSSCSLPANNVAIQSLLSAMNTNQQQQQQPAEQQPSTVSSMGQLPASSLRPNNPDPYQQILPSVGPIQQQLLQQQLLHPGQQQEQQPLTNSDDLTAQLFGLLSRAQPQQEQISQAHLQLALAAAAQAPNISHTPLSQAQQSTNSHTSQGHAQALQNLALLAAACRCSSSNKNNNNSADDDHANPPKH